MSSFISKIAKKFSLSSKDDNNSFEETKLYIYNGFTYKFNFFIDRLKRKNIH